MSWTERASRLFCLAVYLLGLYAALRLLLPAAYPFLIALALGALVHSGARRLSKLTGVATRACAFFLVTLLLLALSVLVFVVCRRLVFELGKAVRFLLQNSSRLSDSLYLICERLPLLRELSDTLGGLDIAERATSLLARLASALGTALTGIIKATPAALLSVGVGMISLYYVSLEFDKIRAFFAALTSRLPESVKTLSGGFLHTLLTTSLAYLKAELKMFALTLAECFLGLLIICPQYACLGAIAIATLDALPIVGAGIVLVPWAIVSLLGGKTLTGIGLLVLYLTVTVVRQIAEPRIVGKNIGLHPLASLVAMYVGYRLFGVFGMLLCPIAVAVARGARDAVFKLF